MANQKIIILTVTFFLLTGNAIAATDGIYTISETGYTWDGTDASLLNAATADYDYTSGDDNSVTYTLPWPFTFYGQTYTQITVDTNGNVWFGASGNANSFTLPTTGPVIAAWNNDLSSLCYGGVFVQRKTNPERVVIEWQAETFSDEGGFVPNVFELVLFPNGSARIDYRGFSAVTSADFGSGISKSDGSHYLSLTAGVAPVFGLAGRSFAMASVPPPDRVLNLAFAGTGNGFITIAPGGTVCNTNCGVTFPSGTQLTLSPAASAYSLFTGWQNGLCTYGTPCRVRLNESRTRSKRVAQSGDTTRPQA